MKKAWYVLRAVMAILLITAVLVPAAIYVTLSLDPVHRAIQNKAQNILSDLTGAQIKIGNLSYRPLNRIALDNVNIVLADTDTVAAVRRISARVELLPLLRQGRVVVDYALMMDCRLNVWRDSADAPLNVQPVLDRLKGDNSNKDSNFEIALNTLALRNVSMRYNVLDKPQSAPERFDANHLYVSVDALNAYIPNAGKNLTEFYIDHFSAHEQSGLRISNLTASIRVVPDTIAVSELRIEFPNSRLEFAPLTAIKDSVSDFARRGVRLATTSDSYIYPPDFAALAPILADFDESFDVNFNLFADNRHAIVRTMSLRASRLPNTSLLVRATADFPNDSTPLHYDVDEMKLRLNTHALVRMANSLLKPDVRNILNKVGYVALDLAGNGSDTFANVTGNLSGDCGNVNIAGQWNKVAAANQISGDVTMARFQAGRLAGVDKLGTVDGDINLDLVLSRSLTGHAETHISRLEWNNKRLERINATANIPDADHAEVSLNIDNPVVTAMAYAFINRTGENKSMSMTANIVNTDFKALGLYAPADSLRFGAKIVSEIQGVGWQNVNGYVGISDVNWLNSRGKGLRVPRIYLSTDTLGNKQKFELTSPYIEGSAEGIFNFSSLVPQLKNLIAKTMPDIIDAPKSRELSGENIFSYTFKLHDCDDVCRFFNVPAALIADAEIEGVVDSRRRHADFTFDAPYIRQGNKLYEGTYIYAFADSAARCADVFTSTQFATNKGEMGLAANIKASDNNLLVRVDWMIDRQNPLNGTMQFNTRFRKPDIRLLPGVKVLLPVEADVAFSPGTINFGEQTWQIKPCNIYARRQQIAIDGFALQADNQKIDIDGIVGSQPSDSLEIAISDLSLLPIFETLEIDKAMLSGRANGIFKAAGLLSKEPYLHCPALHVDSIGYNRCTIGDADIVAGWTNERQAFYLDADIIGDRNNRSRIAGDIYPFAEALDLNFTASDVPVGFLKPFMEAFTSDISGRASGRCHLFGTFKEIDLTGDVYADNVALKVDFTNTVYHTTDSVHMRPGQILIPSTTIYDEYGHTARLDGWVHHTFFKRPVFRFDISEADNFLSFNGTRAQNPDWYGRIYGNGSASVSGEPGIVNIEADMKTAPGSNFTFVISDRLDAEEFSFVEFRDVTPDSVRTEVKLAQIIPEAVRTLKEKRNNDEEDEPSNYLMNISVDITKDAELTLVMDPATGDDIKATGTGHLTMAYNSIDNDLRLYGSYNVLEGKYHFTLQDIIIKDFNIKEGSTIAFDGDPYAVRTNIQAYYATNANLTDLDKSFQQDHEVARTNVPVHALMNVQGDIRQPDITFDLEFPTLTDDTYRKVRSIVSTDDMMNRQIIYLLALNRFYTPDYMSSTTKGSELFSVASSTLSSQLSSLLGKISNNWSIAPNLRSDRGNFSDVEVDVALSSRLLNNRLLLNGNLGYRDKSLNTNQFVGDFDIEYLLNKRGSWRLKAYNRFNDATYYLRSAATTQGVGIMYRREFDNLFNFLKPKRRNEENTGEDAQPTPAE